MPSIARPNAVPPARMIQPATFVSPPPMIDALPARFVDFATSGMRGCPQAVQYARTPRYTIGALRRQLGQIAPNSDGLGATALRAQRCALRRAFASMLFSGVMAREEWVLLRRYDDGLAAQIALDFLRD